MRVKGGGWAAVAELRVISPDCDSCLVNCTVPRKAQTAKGGQRGYGCGHGVRVVLASQQSAYTLLSLLCCFGGKRAMDQKVLLQDTTRWQILGVLLALNRLLT